MRIWLSGLAVLASLTSPATADDRWPQRQATIIVPFTAGGTTDLFARLVAHHMNAKFGQPFIVENRAGAGGNLGATAAARAAPDGYTLLLDTTSV